MLTAFEIAPKGWAFCNGQLLPIHQYEQLFSLIGTIYGGDGKTTFALPNLQSRTAIHRNATHQVGTSGGAEIQTLTLTELPTHTHAAQANKSTANSTVPMNNLWAAPRNTNAYSATTNQAMNPTTGGTAGANQPHENMPPFITLNFIIALEGIYPPTEEIE